LVCAVEKFFLIFPTGHINLILQTNEADYSTVSSTEALRRNGPKNRKIKIAIATKAAGRIGCIQHIYRKKGWRREHSSCVIGDQDREKIVGSMDSQSQFQPPIPQGHVAMKAPIEK